MPHNGRRVKIDFSQSASPSDRRRGPLNTNDGTRDIGNTQAPVLLFRGLDPLSGPQAIAQAMKNSSGIGNEGAKGMRRILLIKDKVTLGSWGFAFVEFVDNQVCCLIPCIVCRIDIFYSLRLPFSPPQCLHKYTRPGSAFRTSLSLRHLLILIRFNHCLTILFGTTHA